MIQLLCQLITQTSTSASPARISQTTSQSAAQPETGGRALSLYPFDLPPLLYPHFPHAPALKPHNSLAWSPSRICPASLPQDLLGKPPLGVPPPGTHYRIPRPPPNMADEQICVGGKLSLMVQIAPRELWRAGTAILRLPATSPQNVARAPVGRLRDWAERRGREYGRVELKILDAEKGGDGVDYAPYVRNADVQWSVDL